MGKLGTKTCSDNKEKAAVICKIDSQDLRIAQELNLATVAPIASETDVVLPTAVILPQLGTFTGKKCQLSNNLLDLVLVVDDSGSVGGNNFDKVW